MEDFLKLATHAYRELFPQAPDVGGGRSSRVLTPCIVENHQGAESAKAQPSRKDDGGDISAVDLDLDVVESGGSAGMHTAVARVIMELIYKTRMA